MKLVYLHPMGGNLYMMSDVSAVDPGFGVGMPDHPDQGLPGRPVHPDNSLPERRPRPDQSLPGYGHPDQGLPGHGGIPGVPDNSLPTTPPPQVAPGMALIIVRSSDGKWRWASLPAATVPTPLPVPPPGTAQPKA